MSFADYLQTQPLLNVALTLILGIAVGDKLQWLLPLWVWLAAIALCILIELLLKEKPYSQSAMVLLAIFFAGCTLIIKEDKDSEFPFNEKYQINYEAIITNEPQVKGKVLKCDISLTAINGKPLNKPIKVKAAILRDTVKNNWKALKLGSGITAQSVMQPLQNFRKGGNFDYVRYLQCHGFRAQTFVYYSDWQLKRISLAPLSRLSRLKLRALKWREKLIENLQVSGKTGISNDDDQQAAVIAAMVLGDKHTLSKETKDAYSISGASHILALSGLHLSIIYAILTLLFGNGFRHRWLSQALIVIAIWTYVVLVGMGTSVVRSAVMITIYSVCLVAGRDKESVNSLSLAAIIILVANPLTLWDIGFQMSFMAVLAIIIFYNYIYHLLPKRGDVTRFVLVNRLIKFIYGTAVVSFSAQIGSAPLIIYYFGRFSCYFLMTNYIVVPCATIIIYGTFAVFATMPIQALSTLTAKGLAYIATFLNNSVNWIASLPGACIENIHINTLQLFCFYIAIAIVCIICSSYSVYLKAGQKHQQQRFR